MFFIKYKISILTKNKASLFTEILKHDLTYESVEINKDSVILTIKAGDLNKYESLSKSLKLSLTIVKQLGLGGFLYKFWERKGILSGVVLLLFVLFISSKFVWQVNVYGENEMSEQRVVEELSQSGLKVGTYIPDINYGTLHNNILFNSEKIAWVSVNIVGNVANVYIQERKSEETNDTREKYANLVANKDGQISEITVIEGEKKIILGDVVKKGDLLISGVLDSQANGVNYCEANGIVKAYTHNELIVNIGYMQTKKNYTNNVIVENKINLLGNNITFFSNYNKNLNNYDKIEIKKRLNIFGIDNLPLLLTKTKLYEYEYVETVLTKEQAVDMAFLELRKQLDIALNDAELISKDVNIEYSETGVILTCNLYCIENIAKKQEFYIN